MNHSKSATPTPLYFSLRSLSNMLLLIPGSWPYYFFLQLLYFSLHLLQMSVLFIGSAVIIQQSPYNTKPTSRERVYM